MPPKKKSEPAASEPRVRVCATDRVHERLLRDDPGYAERRALSEDQAWRAARSGAAVGRSGCTRIPVVVHVVHRTAAENVSAAQINSQIDILNEDFRKQNADISSIPSPFAPLAADARIQFALADVDPDGNPTDGITRTSTTVNGFSSDDDMKSASTGGADGWPADTYLNLWVCRLAGGLLGYAQFPGGPAATDGVVVTHTAFGSTGTAEAPFNLGRTTTHEVGHWLNLRHIWGDDGTGCSGSDFVADTPNQGGANTGKPSFPRISCMNGPNGDLFVNYMDYVDDDTMVMFTAGQVTRMQATLDGFRSSIGTSIACVGPKPKFSDDVATFKFSDDGGTKLKFSDDVATLKFSDDGGATLKFRDDLQTLPSVDTPKAKFSDDVATLKFRDDVTTSPTRDNPKPKFSDDITKPVGDVPGGGGGGQPGLGGAGPAPFVLATPHHSNAWAGSYPDAYQATVGQLEEQLAAYEQALREYAAAAEAGQLGDADQATLHQLQAEYQQLGAEYVRLVGGGG